ncbi:uncharacterized protein E0L32_002938 [Thyridium curvatum]|uniref:Adenine DNA glycosylase n=1 Tax=Thyridium curvatum TaxID=1093900 RepID=A0A507BD46_9PEZI|nr:uncharacterized protein E0L32_002938 [Thyridium curvatum]TPX17837.1 hypothetical protein E0L32_002938 [Thyridium curvatum]
MKRSQQTLRRQSSIAASKRISVQLQNEPVDEPDAFQLTRRAKQPSSSVSPPPEDASDASSEDHAPSSPGSVIKGEEDEEEEAVEAPQPLRKKQKTTKGGTRKPNGNAQLHERLFGTAAGHLRADREACALSARLHNLSYHRPLLLDGPEGPAGRASLLSWFDSVSTARAMPWRKAWLDPRGGGGTDDGDDDEMRRLLERRAYEVWISEIMLQQTRVAVVIGYWTRWMAAWPTIRDLAAADADDVLAMWRGLGYYSRATRIHEAAKLVVADPAMRGLLPEDARELAAKVPGVGPYTAGAISAIVYGRPAPMVDGNVLRVLSRQLGLYVDVKTEKAVIDLLWAAAGALVKAVAWDGAGTKDGQDHSQEEPPISDRPGQWGQALMELGSTICTPKPDCSSCPITSTCRAYAEGKQKAAKKAAGKSQTALRDVEDLCTFCQPFDEDQDEATPLEAVSDDNAKAKPKAKKQLTLSSFAFKQSTGGKPASNAPPKADSGAVLEAIVNHAKRFPVKTIKKAVRQEEIIVCAIRRNDGQYLIQRRPQKGLLAGLWEFPSKDLPTAEERTPKRRKQLAKSFGPGLLSSSTKAGSQLRHHGELGSVPWLFSHIKLTMHVHLFTLDDGDEVDSAFVSNDPQRPLRWSDSIEDESMGTGMRKCWGLVKEIE